MSGSPIERLTRVTRLTAILGELPQAASLHKIQLTSEAQALLRELTGKPVAGLMDSASVQVALESPNDPQKVQAVLIAYVTETGSDVDAAVARKIFKDKFNLELDSIELNRESVDDTTLLERYQTKLNGVFSDVPLTEPDNAVDAQIQALRSEAQKFSYAESAVAAYEAAVAQVGLPALRASIDAFCAAASADPEYRRTHQAEARRLDTACTKAMNKARSIYDAFCKAGTADIVKRIQDLLDQKSAAGVAAIAQLNALSTVSDADAAVWVANSTTIEASALARLKRDNYRTDIAQDLADFYKITGGKLGKVVLKTDGDSRANTRDVFGDGVHEIYMGTSFSRKTLFHELGHQLERDPVASLLANAFLVRRRESEQTYSLNELTGGRGYATNEVAYKDSWINPYVGKVYRNRTTEVFSMAVEHLSSADKTQDLMVKDREMFDIVTGYLTSNTSELSQFNRALSEARTTQSANATAERQARVDAEHDAIIAKVTIDTQKTEADLWPESEKFELHQKYLRWETKKGSTPQWYGACQQWGIYSGVIKHHRTHRWVKGFVLIDSQKGAGWSGIKTVSGDERALKLALGRLAYE